MAQEINHLSMIGHGTTGSDGIGEGIHLRWSFNDKLGFPPCFKLYRRKSDEGNRYHFPIEDTPISDLLLPYSVRVIMNNEIRFTLHSLIIEGADAGFVNVESVTLPGGTSQRCFHILSGELTILFSKPIARLELVFFLEADSKLKLTALSNNNELYEPYTVQDGDTGLQKISFDIPGATGIKIGGFNIKLTGLNCWLPVNGNGWKRINDYCGCGLPVNQEGTPYTNDVYQLIGKDLAMALCRLGYRRVEDSPITALEFIELKAMLLTMVAEGLAVPVGWTLFPNAEEDTDTALELSKYDFLLTQSLQVFFAKILGLYFLDTDVEDGKYYDYKVTAEWPSWLKRRLDHEIIFDDYVTEQFFFPVWQINEHIVLAGAQASQIVEQPYIISRTELGLELTSENLPIVLSFLKPVTEVQLVIVNPEFGSSTMVSAEAYKNLHSVYTAKEVLTAERGMLRLRAEQIDTIKIFASHVIICRIHYDFEAYPIGLQEYIIGGLKKQNHLHLAKPAGLTASFIPGGTVTGEDGSITERPYLAGLRWNANENPDKELISIAPVLFHLERKPEGGPVELVTEDSPLFVSPSIIENNKINNPIGWPQQRQYYTEAITPDTIVNYRIAAIDLFGRQSGFTDFETYEIAITKPPCPVDVTAKFLDYATYNLATDSFSDVTLNVTEQNWLRSNRKNAILVNWKWTENLQLQAPDAEGFNIYYKQGWLNNYTGIVVSDAVETIVTKTSLNLTPEELKKYAMLNIGPENIPVYEFQILLQFEAPPPPEPVPHVRTAERDIVPEDAFRLCWITQGNQSFLILKNNGNAPHPSLWVLKLNNTPIKNKGFGIVVTFGSTYFINYKDPENWTDTRVSHQEPKNLTLKKNPETTAQPVYKESYKVYIEDPEFPYPAIIASDRNKVRYAQIGVNTFAGETEGTVSSPSTIMAIYREVPTPPAAFAPQQGVPVQALKATAANVHGKSCFALRWNKVNLPVKHYVYRSADETLFSTDNKLRQTRNLSVYDDFKINHPEFNLADVDVIRAIPYESDPGKVAAGYAALTPGQLQTLASLPDNENAFTKINDTAIDENDPVYADRVTEIPDPVNGAGYTPDTTVLLYIDKMLNGQSSNRYFYALRSVDTNGLQSMLSIATPPVEIPKTTPPPAPVITSISGGENQVIVKWAKRPGITIAGYLLYRTQEIKDAQDWRKMELIKANDTDLFTVTVNGSLPDKEFVFMDTSVIARQGYYYGLVAVRLSDEGKWLRSKLSNAKTGQAYDQTPPEPPVWISVTKLQTDLNVEINLKWQSIEKLKCLLKRREINSESYSLSSEWLDIGVYNAAENLWEYEYSDSTFIQPGSKYVYRISVMDSANNFNQSQDSDSI
jgi:hypothetical protein